MKTTIFTDVLDETVIEVGEPKDETIKKLMAQRFSYRERDCTGNTVRFCCDKKGNIVVRSSSDGVLDSNPFYIKGRVYQNGKKTLVELCSVRERFGIVYSIVAIVICIILAAAHFIAKIAFELQLNVKDCVFIALLAINIGLFFVSIKNSRKNKDADLEIMKKAAIDRIKAVERWDD